MKDADNPYVGVRSFTAGERLFGRDRERSELVDLVVAERVVILHAPSGAGKTSLLQARDGVLDKLRDEGFAVLPVARVGLPPPTPPPENRYLDSLLGSLAREPPGGAPPVETLEDLVTRRAEAVGVVLTIDQFEEILTVDPGGETQRAAFFHALGHALENRRLWAILALREEHLGALAPYRPLIPTHLRTTYRLDLLGPEAAKEAIVGPARALGVSFTDAAAEKLVRELRTITVPLPGGKAERKLGTGVEPVALQVVCHRLWSRRAAGAKEISEADIDAVESVDAALSDYYAAAITAAARVESASERRMRDWVERDLVTRAGVRGQVMRSGERGEGVPDAAVQRLIDAYLFRQDTRRGVDWIELAHDRLIKPICANNAAWRKEHLHVAQVQAALWEEHGRGDALCLRGEALAEAEEWAARRRDELTPIEEQFLAASRKLRTAEQKEKRRHRRYLALGIVVVVIVMAFGGWALRERQNAVRERMMACAGDLLRHGEPARAMKLLLEVGRPEKRDWVDLANEALNAGGIRVTLRGEDYWPFAAFDPDGMRVLAPTLDHEVRVWSATGSGEPVVLPKQDGAVVAAIFSPDGTKIATASADGEVRLWSADGSGTPLVLGRFEKRAVSVEFSWDGKKIVAASDDDKAQVWRVDGSGPPVVLDGHNGRVVSAAFSRDGRKVVTASSDATARIWNADGSGTPVVLTGHTDELVSAGFNQEGTQVVTASWDRTARVWNARDGQLLFKLEGHTRFLRTAAFSPDSTKIVTASEDWTARVWDAHDGRGLAVLRGHSAPVYSAEFSRDRSGRIVTAAGDGTARVWNFESSEEPIVLRGHNAAVTLAAFSRDGKQVVTASEDKTVRVWNAHGSGEPVTSIGGTVGSSGAWSSDFKQMVRTDELGTTRVLTIDGSREPIVLPERKDMASAFSPDGKKIVTASWDHTARVQNADGSGEPVVLVGHSDVVAAAAFSPDGKKIVTASWDHTARVWNADGSGEPIILEGHSDVVRCAAFSRNGRLILTGSDDNTARLWSADDGRPIRTLSGHKGPVWAVAFSEDQDHERIVTGSDDNTARLWSADDGRPIGTFPGHNGPVLAAAFSKDGKLIVTGSKDHTARVWNADRPDDEPIVLYGHTSSVNAVAFDVNLLRVVTVSTQSNLKIWDLSPEALRDKLKSALPSR